MCIYILNVEICFFRFEGSWSRVANKNPIRVARVSSRARVAPLREFLFNVLGQKSYV